MAIEQQPLASLAITHVHYDPTDTLSYLCAWAALLPQLLCIVYTTLLYTTREVEIALTFAGQLGCEAINWGLKRWIKEERPERVRYLGKGYGMPSSHAQFVVFWAVYVALFLMLRHSPCLPRYSARPRPTTAENKTRAVGATAPTSGGDVEHISPVYRLQLHNPKITHTILSIVFSATAGFVCWSRIYLEYHTPKQVAVGAGVGALCAVCWFSMTEFARRSGLVEWLLEWDLVRSARVRDLCCEEDLVELGWQVWEERRRRRGISKDNKKQR